jgi:hypothetical protein
LRLLDHAVVHFFFSIALESLVKQGFKPRRSIFLASGFDEEASGTFVRSYDVSLRAWDSMLLSPDREHNPSPSTYQVLMARIISLCWLMKEVCVPIFS